MLAGFTGSFAAPGPLVADNRPSAIPVDTELVIAVDISAAPDGNADLSEREAAVMQLIAQGYTNKEIAAQLGVSVKTVETYKARSMDKLGLRSRVDIMRIATERGWLPGR